MELDCKVCVFLLAIAFTVHAQDPLSVKFEDNTAREVMANSPNLKFSCRVNRDLLYVVQNTVQIIRRPATGGDDVILTQAAKRVEAEPTFYNVNIKPQPDNTITIEFEIITVRDIDDGELVCKVSPGDASGSETAEDSVEIVVIRPLESLQLQFDTDSPISESTDSPLEVDSGSYTVKCIAEGSNPAAKEVHLTLNGGMVAHGDPLVEEVDGGVRKYRVTLEASVDLSVENSGQELECTAESKAGDQLVTSLPIKINVYEPIINCTDGEAYSGKMYPQLTCHVDHAGLNVVGFGYQLAENGDVHHEVINDGDQNKDFAEVLSEKISEDETLVHLKLYQAEDWHFDTPFFVLVHHADGHTSRGIVHLHSAPGDRNHGNLVSASLTTLFLSLLCAWRRSL